MGYGSRPRPSTAPGTAGEARDRGPTEPTAAPAAERPARQRRERATEPAVDAESLINQVVGRLQAQGNAEAERLRDAMRKAMAVLASAIGEA